ncbi:MAG: hypothetical protein WAL12_20995 [Trebonia sp.]
MSRAGRAVAAADKVRGALEDHLQGYTWEQVAERNGYSSRQTACRAVTRYLARHPSPEVEQIREEEELQLQAIRRELWDIARRKHYFRTEDGELIRDDSQNIAALNTLARLSESRRRLHGADVPVVTRLQIEESQTLDAEIVEAVAEIVDNGTNVYPLALPEARLRISTASAGVSAADGAILRHTEITNALLRERLGKRAACKTVPGWDPG